LALSALVAGQINRVGKKGFRQSLPDYKAGPLLLQDVVVRHGKKTSHTPSKIIKGAIAYAADYALLAAVTIQSKRKLQSLPCNTNVKEFS
jgi:hypothetical protein